MYLNNNSCLYVDNVMVDWSAKAACTTVVQMVFKKLGLLDKAIAYHPTGWVHDWRQEVYDHQKTINDNTSWTDPNIFKIKFVRCPYHRAVSSYIHSQRHPQLANQLPPDMSFHQFLNLLLKKQIPNNPHWNLQARPRESVDNKLYNHIIRIENMEQDLASIQDRIQFPVIEYDHHHVHKIIDEHAKYPAHDKPYTQIKQQGFPTYDCYYQTPLSKELVESIYSRDCNFYGYNYPF